jgi:flagellar protein FlaI
MDKDKITLENKILDVLKNKIDSSLVAKEKSNIFLDTFTGFCSDLKNQGASDEKACLWDDRLRDDFLKELRSYGMIDLLLNDPLVEDIIINGTQPIYIHHTIDGLKKTESRFSSLEEINLLIKKLLVYDGKKELKKINNLDLLDMRGRANIVYSPFGPEITIAKIRTQPLSIIDLINNGTLSCEIAALLWLYVEGLKVKPANIMISGGPGSGKTTLLNALLAFIPADQHIVVIEDTLELMTGWINDVSRLESSEGLTLADLVKNSLRMRPERIIIGETRGQEAQDMMTAMNIGKYCMSTIHASTARETILRLENAPMNIPAKFINMVDVFIVMQKIVTEGNVLRVIEEIAETSGLEQKVILLSPLWKFDTINRSFNKLMPTNAYRDRLATSSGKSGKMILDEIDKRSQFLEFLRQKGITDIEKVSFHCQSYLNNPQSNKI